MLTLFDIHVDSCPDHNRPLLTPLCQELCELERLGAKLLAQFGRLERLGGRAPTQQPWDQFRERVDTVDHHRPALASRGLLGLEGIVLALAHPADDAGIEAHAHADRRWG